MAAMSATAQTHFRGTVTDRFAPIANATVRVLDGGTRTTLATVSTDRSGHFEVKGLPPGHYEVAIAARGFTSRLMSTGQLFRTEATVRRIELEPEDCDAPNVVCDSFDAVNASDPHPVVLTRDVTLDINRAVDLRSGLIVSPDSPSAGVQLIAERGGIRVVPLHAARLSAPCGSSYHSLGSIRIDGLDSGTMLCIEDRDVVSKIFFAADVPLAPTQISIRIVTRR
jgi:hypothetical protein